MEIQRDPGCFFNSVFYLFIFILAFISETFDLQTVFLKSVRIITRMVTLY